MHTWVDFNPFIRFNFPLAAARFRFCHFHFGLENDKKNLRDDNQGFTFFAYPSRSEYYLSFQLSWRRRARVLVFLKEKEHNKKTEGEIN